MLMILLAIFKLTHVECQTFNFPQVLYPQQRYPQEPQGSLPQGVPQSGYYPISQYVPQTTDSSEDAYLDGCRCSCDDCLERYDCCREFCLSCKTYQNIEQPLPQSIYYIPFPMPIVIVDRNDNIVYRNLTNGNNTMVNTDTSHSSSVPPTETEIIKEIPIDEAKKKFLLTSITKVEKGGKYEILPIPDDIAQQIIKQVIKKNYVAKRKTLGLLDHVYLK